MTALDIVIAAWCLLCVALVAFGIRHETRKQRAAPEQREADLLLPHGGWIEQHDLDRQVEIAIAQAYRAYDQYRGEVK